jgi:hypothetical protein
MRDLCSSAKQGRVCIDDLCRACPDNTLCGFDQSEYDELTRGYDDDEPDYCLSCGESPCLCVRSWPVRMRCRDSKG